MSLTILQIISKELKEALGIEDFIPEGEYREFRLCRAGVKDPSSSRAFSTPQGHIYPGKAMIRDPFDKNAKDKLIMNITGYTPIQGKPGEPIYYDPKIEAIRFDSSGSIKCKPEDYNQYLFLMADNRRREHPYRKSNKSPLYYLVDEKKEIESKNNSFAYKTLAGGLLLDIESDELAVIALKVQRAYPTKYAIDLTAAPEKLMATLNSIADKDPLDIILAVKEDNTYARVLVDDAVNRRVIFFDDHEEKREWKWKRTPGQKGKVVICKVDKGNKPVNALVEFLLAKDGTGNEHWVELKAQHEEYYSKKPR